MADYITRGDDEDLAITVLDSNNQPVNISNATVFVTLRLSPDDTDDTTAELKHDVTLGDDADTQAGKAVVSLPRAKTELLVATEHFIDIQLLLDSKIKTVYNGTIEVRQDVTKRDTPEV